MVCGDTEVDAMRPWRSFWIDDVVQKRHSGRNQSSEQLRKRLTYWREKGADLYCFFDQVPLPAGLQEGPETALCGTVKAARWQQDNLGGCFRLMTSHKN